MFKLEKPEEDKFEFEYEGTVYSIPSITALPMRVAMSFYRDLAYATSDMQKSSISLEFGAAIFEEHAPGLVEQLSLEEFKTLMAAYNGQDVSLGE